MNRIIAALSLCVAALAWPINSKAATFTVGNCPGATHAGFAEAFNELGTTAGQPHTIRLCPDQPIATQPLSANWGHAGLTIESVSGSPGNTSLTASGDRILTAQYQDFTLRNITVDGELVANGYSNFTVFGAILGGNIETNGNIDLTQTDTSGNLISNNGIVSINGGQTDGDILGRNAVNATNADITGSVTATNGAIEIEGGQLDAVIGTSGGNQPITLTGVTMTGGSVETSGNEITIANSTLGSPGNPVPVTANNGINVNDSQIWGDLTAANWADIFLNPATAVYGTCTPEAIGGGFCGDPSGDCSDFIGKATINEAYWRGNAERFVELRILDPGIGAGTFEDWSLRICSSERSPCITRPLSSSSFDHSGYPWLLLTQAGIPHRDYIDFGHGGDDGMEIRLDDEDGRAIDYLSVDGYSDELAVDCPFQYDTTMGSTNSFGIMRLPDGTGDWDTDGPGNSRDETPGESNDGGPAFPGPDHLRIIHPGQGITCSPEQITIQACADANCDSLYGDEITVELTSPDGIWGANPVLVNGTTTVELQVTSAGTVELSAASQPASTGVTRCFANGTEACQMTWNESGFLLEIPDHVADSVISGSIAAVRSDPGNPEQCLPGFANDTKGVGFRSLYADPGSGSLQVVIDGAPIGTSAPGNVIPIAFDGSGVGGFQLRYPDVGAVEVHARYVGSGDEAGLIMTGEDRFIARPARFTLEIPGNPAAADASGDDFTTAGSGFEVTVAARNVNNGVTPNFGLESSPEDVTLELSLVAPVGGTEPGLVGGFGDFGTDCDGNSATPGTACGTFSWPEVGIISLNPRLLSGAYLGTGDVVGTPIDYVGRFIPDHFQLSGGDIVNRAGLSACSASSFTYIGERFDVEFTLSARNTDGMTTANYEGDFAFLGGSELGLSGSPTPEVDAATADWIMGVGDASARLTVPRSNPVAPYPDYQVTTAPVDSDGVSLIGNDLVDSTVLRFGRLVIDNAVGSELGPLELSWRTEYWDGSTWLTSTGDDCSVLKLAADIQLASSGGDSGDGTTTMSLGGGSTAVEPGESDLTLGSGIGSIQFSAPGVPGWVDVLLTLGSSWPYLRDDLDDDSAYDDDPRARASFGLFDGNEQRIYIREIAPQ